MWPWLLQVLPLLAIALHLCWRINPPEIVHDAAAWLGQFPKFQRRQREPRLVLGGGTVKAPTLWEELPEIWPPRPPRPALPARPPRFPDLPIELFLMAGLPANTPPPAPPPPPPLSLEEIRRDAGRDPNHSLQTTFISPEFRKGSFWTQAAALRPRT